MVLKDKIQFKQVTEFIEWYTSQYNLRDLRYISLLPSKKETINGVFSAAEEFIRINVNTDRSRYPLSHTDWGRRDTTETKQGWITDSRVWTFDTPEQTLIFAFGRMFFPFLSHTRQIKDINGDHIKNVHANATWFGEQMISEYRDYRTNLILKDGKAKTT